jgi:hypothetical protein
MRSGASQFAALTTNQERHQNATDAANKCRFADDQPTHSSRVTESADGRSNQSYQAAPQRNEMMLRRAAKIFKPSPACRLRNSSAGLTYASMEIPKIVRTTLLCRRAERVEWSVQAFQTVWTDLGGVGS